MAKVEDYSEDALIDLIAPRLPVGPATLVGPGDDAAVLSLEGDLAVSSDVLVEKRHFRKDWSTAQDVGFRAAMQNLADIDAMGAVPVALQVTLALPGSTEVDWVLGLADGLREACDPYDVGVVGGDLSSGRTIAISVTALGDMAGQPPVTRAGARPGDTVAVAGPMGAAVAGFFQLENGLVVSEECIDLFRRPRPRIGSGLEAARARAHAMMDVSDGLVRDLARMARASGVRIEIDGASVPIHRGARAVAETAFADPVEWALTGGEDHHLVAAFRPGARLPDGWTAIGECMVGEPGLLVDGKPKSGGWDHFSQG